MILTTNTPYPSRKIRRIRACTHQRPQRKEDQYAVSREDQYAILDIWHVNILEDIKRGPYSKKLQYAISNPLDTPDYIVQLISSVEVMSTPAHFDSEIISQTDEAQSSRVPTLFLDDLYVAVRQAYLVDTDTESRPLEHLREIEIPQPLLVVPSPIPSSDDLYLTVGQAHTPATKDTESEPEEAPSEIEEFLPLVSRAPLTDEEFEASKPSDTRTTSSHSPTSSESTAPLSPDHPLTQTSPTLTPT
ncbi:hypothetical protein Tco_0484160 [Tanacetum coccineum]